MPESTSAPKILEGLNPGQRKAVCHGFGPQLVVAGAGTGKTAVITRRIAHLVASKTCAARSILALTFTDKAAGEMESRVDQLVPYGFTDSTICTFHAFGDRLLREQVLLLGLPGNYRLLSKTEQLIFLRENLFELPLRRLRPLADPTRHLESLLGLISRAKDEDITADRYLDYVRTVKASASGDPAEADCVFWEKQEEVAGIFHAYQSLMAKAGFLDFGDLITHTLALLRQNPDLLEAYRQQYAFILVDEFQDTNTAQFELLKLLAGKQGNITVVGDDDQSIYKFRGAAISNILQFTRHYPAAEITVLTENYRSTQAILDSAYRLIRNNDPERLEVKHGLDKRLVANRGLGAPVQYQAMDTVSAEADWIADEIAKRRKQHALAWSDFALLVRANRHADPYIRALNMRSIPFRFSGTPGLFRSPEIRLATSFLRVIADPADSLAFYELAISELYALPAEDAAQLAALSRRRHQPMKSLLQAQLAAGQNGESPLSPAGKDAGRRLLDDLEIFSDLSRRLPCGQLLYRFLTETGWLKRLTEANSLEAEHTIKNLAKFFQSVQHYEGLARSDRAIHFVQHLNMLQELGEDPAGAEPEPDLDAVSILTVHRSKGLEFPVVFIPGLSANRFPGIHRSASLTLPDGLLKEEVSPGDQFLAEERRLFYVAMTRAKDQLILTSAQDYGGSRLFKPSRFVAEALELPLAAVQRLPASALEQIRSHAPLPENAVAGAAAAGGEVSLSYYQIDDYLTCPLKYKYIHLLKVPVLPHHTILYGNALHTAVSDYYRRRLAGQDADLGHVQQVFLDTWVNEGFISREHEELRQAAGLQALQRFHRMASEAPALPAFIEKSFAYFLGTVKITGRMDRVDTHGGQVAIVDFKSSDVADQKEADKKARESLQLRLYASAWLRTEGRLPDKTQLHFLDSGLVGTWVPDPEKVEELESLALEVAQGVRNADFQAKPNVWTCNFCAFRSVCPQAALD